MRSTSLGLFILFSLLQFPASASPSDDELVQQFAKLSDKYGLLLLDLDVGGAAPAIEIRRIFTSGSTRSPKPISLKDKDKGFHFISLPAGNYQIVNVNAPYFNLPYRLDTENDPHWSFTVEEGKINYLGKLIISKERNEHSVDVKLINRIATHINVLGQKFPQMTKKFPVRQAGRLNDTFLEEWRKVETP